MNDIVEFHDISKSLVKMKIETMEKALIHFQIPIKEIANRVSVVMCDNCPFVEQVTLDGKPIFYQEIIYEGNKIKVNIMRGVHPKFGFMATKASQNE